MIHSAYLAKVLDGVTLVNLDVLLNSSSGASEGSLLRRMDSCKTPFGTPHTHLYLILRYTPYPHHLYSLVFLHTTNIFQYSSSNTYKLRQTHPTKVRGSSSSGCVLLSPPPPPSTTDSTPSTTWSRVLTSSLT